MAEDAPSETRNRLQPWNCVSTQASLSALNYMKTSDPSKDSAFFLGVHLHVVQNPEYSAATGSVRTVMALVSNNEKRTKSQKSMSTVQRRPQNGSGIITLGTADRYLILCSAKRTSLPWSCKCHRDLRADSGFCRARRPASWTLERPALAARDHAILPGAPRCKTGSERRRQGNELGRPTGKPSWTGSTWISVRGDRPAWLRARREGPSADAAGAAS